MINEIARKKNNLTVYITLHRHMCTVMHAQSSHYMQAIDNCAHTRNTLGAAVDAIRHLVVSFSSRN